jgi:hypothetical protein
VKAITTNSHTMAAYQRTNNNTKIWVDKKWVKMIWVAWMVIWEMLDNMISRITITKVSIQTNKLIQISWEETNHHKIMTRTTQTWMMDNQSTPTVCSAETETSTKVPKTKMKVKQMNTSTMLETSVISQLIM